MYGRAPNIRRFFKGKPRNNVEILIVRMEMKWAWGNLCSVGQERLKWWRANRTKFTTITEAIKTWTPEQILAFTNWLGLYKKVSYEKQHLNCAYTSCPDPFRKKLILFLLNNIEEKSGFTEEEYMRMITQLLWGLNPADGHKVVKK